MDEKTLRLKIINDEIKSQELSLAITWRTWRGTW